MSSVALALFLYVKFFSMLYFLQGFRRTGALIRMIVQIAQDIRWYDIYCLVPCRSLADA